MTSKEFVEWIETSRKLIQNLAPCDGWIETKDLYAAFANLVFEKIEEVKDDE